MNCEPATAFSHQNFEAETLAFDQIPNQSRLFLDFQHNSDSIQKFYPGNCRDFKTLSDEVLENYKVDRNALCDLLVAENTNLDATGRTLDNIEKLRDEDCVAVIAGQQAGLFSGSMYTIYKALSAIKLAGELNDQGIKAVPIFWVASEDHDFDEVNETFVLGDDGEVTGVSNDVEGVEENTPVAFVELDTNIKQSIEKYVSDLRKTEFTEDVKKLLEKTYQPNETYSSAFAKFILKLLGDCGLILVSPMSRGLRKLCSPIFVEAIEKHQEITAALTKRDAELEEGGYHSQVLVDEDFFPFFYLDDDNKRNALRFDPEKGLVKSLTSEQTFEVDELLVIARNSPHRLSPNALMRPVVQDFLFPTVCYYGGGAEIAYFAQNQTIYETLGRPATRIRHRASFTVIEPKTRRTLDRYELEFSDVFRGKDDLLATIIEKLLANETANVFEEVDETINRELTNLESALVKSDPTLSESLKNRRKKIQWHLETLRKKFHKAETLKNDVLRRRIEFAISSLYPREGLQERTINVLYFLNLFGPNFIPWLIQAIDLDETEHQILSL